MPMWENAVSLHCSLEYEQSENLAIRAAEAFVRSRHGKKTPLDAKVWRSMLILLLCAGVSASLAGLGYLAEVPVAVLFVPLALLGLFGGVVFLAMFSLLAGIVADACLPRVVRRRMVAAVPPPDERGVRWTFTDDGFEVQSAGKARQVPWSAVRFIMPSPDFWFLSVEGSPDLVLPVENLADDVRDSIRSKVAATAIEGRKEQGEGLRAQEQITERKSQPFATRGTTELFPSGGHERRSTRNLPLRRFASAMVAIAVTVFLLQRQEFVGAEIAGKHIVVISALALGAGFPVVLLIRRALKPANREIGIRR
jgi:hypothetical protein